MKNKNFKLEADFYRFFHNVNIENLFRQVEDERKSIALRFYVVMFLCGFVPVGIFWALYKLKVSLAVVLVCVLGISVAGYVLFGVLKAAYEEEYRAKVRPFLAPNFFGFFKDILYCHEPDIIPNTVLFQSKLFGKFDGVIVDDAIAGKRKNIPFVMSKNTMTVLAEYTVFQGVCLLFKLKKKVKGTTIVRTKKIFSRKEYVAFGWLVARLILAGSILIGWFLSQLYSNEDDIFRNIGGILLGCGFLGWAVRHLVRFFEFRREHHKVRLESSDFMDKWKVQTDDQIEARYLLTPAFMQVIMDLETVFRGHIDISFWDENLLLAVHTKRNILEPVSLLSDATDMKSALPAVYNMDAVLSIIEILAQTKDIYTIKRQY